MNTLPVAFVDVSQCLEDDAGLPVWPLTDNREVGVVTSLAALFGATLQEVPAQRSNVPRGAERGAEFVLAIGDAAVSAGALYAHLTRRAFRSTKGSDVLAACDRPAVVVTTPDGLSFELLDWLYDGSGAFAPGIVCATPGRRMLEQVLLRSAAATLSAATALSGLLHRRRIEVFPTVPTAKIQGPGLEIYGSESSVSERREALSAGADILTVMTHSDGVDAFIGPELTLCAMVSTDSSVSLDRAPRCRLTGHCHRHDRPVSDVTISEFVVAPETVSARVLLWDVCFGVMPAGSIVDPRFGIGTRLLEHAGVGAILTTWQIVLSSPEHIRQLSASIASGVPIGVALHEFNTSAASRSRHHRMCLLGDPRLCLVADSELAVASDGAAPSSPLTTAGDVEDLALARLCMTDAKLHTGGARAKIAAEALDAIVAFDSVASKGVPIQLIPPQLGAQMRKGILEFAMARGKLLENWMPFAHAYRAGAARPCPVCDRRADCIEVTFRPRNVSDRRILLCPMCGVLEDAPVSLNVTLELIGRRVLLRGDVARERWAAFVLLASADPSDALRLPWPANADGTPARAAELPAKWPEGPLRLSVMVAWDAHFAILSRMTRFSKAVADP